MKSSALDRNADTGGTPPTRRRSLLLGAGVAGAAAIAAKTLPVAPEQAVAQANQPAAADPQQGYRLTQHVLRYYETTKV
ncbi:formate dehydrogenase [Piscinibacter sp. XHJ-5]|uniref:formate dehydrogenase n=1 Tax=Piscinibacter sp. XHJ-5 TaxID=3037797 RepID=UPI002452C934|nr:formate dehydrogenase [Piscinibacter sp. XHJ-5]